MGAAASVVSSIWRIEQFAIPGRKICPCGTTFPTADKHRMCQRCRREGKRHPEFKGYTYARGTAFEAGEVKYLGTPCRHGHNGLRYSRDGVCVECKAEKGKQRVVHGSPRSGATVHATGATSCANPEAITTTSVRPATGAASPT